MLAPNEPDVYDDKLQPEFSATWITYRVTVPGEYRHDYWADVLVEPGTDYCVLSCWKWGEYRQPRPAIYSPSNWHLLEVEKRVWEWLVEWELVELKAIGPEDSEYFATTKLTGE